jgi:hypothetical protein
MDGSRGDRCPTKIPKDLALYIQSVSVRQAGALAGEKVPHESTDGALRPVPPPPWSATVMGYRDNKNGLCGVHIDNRIRKLTNQQSPPT